jgi:hypothetical protein
MSAIPSSTVVYVYHLADLLRGLGPYAHRQFALELVAKSSAAFGLLERYAALPPELCRAYGVIAPPVWRIK